MADYTVKRIDEMEAIYRGAFKRARAELGVSAFGMQVIDLPPSLEALEHNHSHDGQEEVYVPLTGSGELAIGDERVPLEPGVMVRVGAETTRNLHSGADGLRVLIVGGTPGALYEPPENSLLGGADPMAQGG